jgi:flagellar biosynthesis protein FlhB
MSNLLPTKEKLARLREYGIVPYSSLATRFFCAGLTLMVLILSAAQIEKTFNISSAEILSSLDMSNAQRGIGEYPFLRGSLWLFFLPPLVVFLATFVFGLLQTRFFAGGLSSSRDRDFSRYRGPFSEKILLRIAALFAIYVSAFLVGVVVMYLGWPRLVRVFYAAPDAWVLIVPQLISSLLPYLAALLVAFSLFALFLYRFAFMLLHRMTYQDIMQEQRES